LAVSAALFGCASVPRHEAGKSYIAEKGAEIKKEAMSAYARGDLRSARAKFMEALRIDRSIENRGSEIEDLINIGRLSILLNEAESAKYYLYDAVRVGVDYNDEHNLSEAYSSLALADRSTGDYGAALDSIDESINIDRRLGVVSGAKLNQKASIYIETGRNEDAALILQQAVKINRLDGNGPEIANSYRTMAELSDSLKSYDEAIRYYAKAYDIDKSHGDTRNVALDLERIGELKVKKGAPQEAIALFEKSYIVRFNSHQVPEALVNLDRLIETCRSVGDENKAAFYRNIKTGIMKDPYGGKTVTR